MIEARWRERGALAGLGLRREIAAALLAAPAAAFDFLELAPENWIGVGGQYARRLREFSERYPLTLHGLSLNLGGFAPLDEDLLSAIAGFIKTHNCRLYSEHLSYCADHGHLYDLMPIPFRRDAIGYLAGRVQRVQDAIGQRLVLENVSYYAAPAAEMSESDFICELLQRADCELLLDVNNVYVNSINHGYDPVAFMRALPASRVRYMHIAGHYVEAEDLRVDTHGAAVIDDVWALLEQAYNLFGVVPTLLERDFNFPPVEELYDEVAQIRRVQSRHAEALEKGLG